MTLLEIEDLEDLRRRGHSLSPGQLRVLRDAAQKKMPELAETAPASEVPGSILVQEEVQSDRIEIKGARIKAGEGESGLEKDAESEKRSVKPAKRIYTEAQKRDRVEAQRLRRQKKRGDTTQCT